VHQLLREGLLREGLLLLRSRIAEAGWADGRSMHASRAPCGLRQLQVVVRSQGRCPGVRDCVRRTHRSVYSASNDAGTVQHCSKESGEGVMGGTRV
jgi:hypothetical protein